MGKTVYNGFEPFLHVAQLKDSKMKNLILIALMFLVACGSGSEDTLERPSVSPPDETEEPNETPEEPEEDLPPESYVFDISGYKRTISTRNLYNAEKIEVFYNGRAFITGVTQSFKSVLSSCLSYGEAYGHSHDNIGVLSGIGKEEGFTKDFLLNPDVERTWSGIDGVDSASIARGCLHFIAVTKRRHKPRLPSLQNFA